MNTLGRAYDRGFDDGSAGREFAPPYVKTVNRDLYAHGYYSGEYAFNQNWLTFSRQHRVPTIETTEAA